MEGGNGETDRGADPAGDLARDIDAFLAAHARTSADYDPRFDAPGDRFNGPDPAMMYAAARALEAGQPAPDVWSGWESGCYHPYGDRQARSVHDGLLERLKAFRPDAAPGPRR